MRPGKVLPVLVALWVTVLDPRAESLQPLTDFSPLAKPGFVTEDSGTDLRIHRPGQSAFRKDVLARYGESCALCSVGHGMLLDAAHIAEVKDGGSDRPENGLMLCATHHRAFDAGLIGIHPETLEVHLHPQATEIGVQVARLEPPLPHERALRWRWERLEDPGSWPRAEGSSS